MEAFILTGDSKENTNLLLQIAKKLNINARRLSNEETEEMGIWLSIMDGMKSGLLGEEEKKDFVKSLSTL